ncbi:Glycosyl transferase family 2 [uncultured archaeon]|nr:Glycosyl transferase family 2 [uncultured archaeon]
MDTSQFVNEILVINDRSADKTADAAISAGATVLDNIVNCGLGKTIKRGYEEAIRRGSDIVVHIHADGQYDPNEPPEHIRTILDNKADVFSGSSGIIMYK